VIQRLGALFGSKPTAIVVRFENRDELTLEPGDVELVGRDGPVQLMASHQHDGSLFLSVRASSRGEL
jgi:hypothetical protein